MGLLLSEKQKVIKHRKQPFASPESKPMNSLGIWKTFCGLLKWKDLFERGKRKKCAKRQFSADFEVCLQKGKQDATPLLQWVVMENL